MPATSTTSRRTLAKVWAMGIGAWGHRWTSALGELPLNDDGSVTVSAALWSRHLAGIPERDVLAAIDHFAGRSDWPPSLAEIRKQAFGIPSLVQVRREITQDVERSPFTRSVWALIDAYAFRHASSKDADRLLQAAYDAAQDLAMDGQPLPQPAAAAIEQDEQRAPVVPETREARIERLRTMLGEDFNPEAAAAAGEDDVREMHRAGKVAAAGPDA